MPVSKQKQTETRTLEVGRVEGCVDGERKLFWSGEQREVHPIRVPARLPNFDIQPLGMSSGRTVN